MTTKEPAKPRIYIVTPKEGKARLVKAMSPSAALKHVVDDTLAVDYASQDDLVRVMREQPDTMLEEVRSA